MPTQQVNVYLRLLNGRRFQSAMYQSALSVRHAKREMEMAASAGSGLGMAGHTAAGGMHAVSAAARTASYGVGILAASWVAMGIDFNATIESNSLAFSHFAGGVKQGQAMVEDMWDIASRTPFSFEDITSAARRFMAFGFNVQETTDLLKIMGDTMSLTGGGTDEIMRFAKAMGDIRAKGRLMQQEMNQLANLGIPALEVLKAGGLDLTEKQLRNIGRAGIDSDEALGAMRKGLQKIFGGGAQKYLETFSGQWQRLRDNIRRSAGQSTTGVFGWMKNGLKTVNKLFEGGNAKWPQTLKKIIEDAFKVIGAAFVFVKERGKEFLDAIAPAAPFFNNVLLPIIKGFAVGLLSTLVVAWKMFIAVLKFIAPILGWVGQKLAFLKPVFFMIGFALSFLFGGIVRVAGWMMRLGGIVGSLGRILFILAAPFRLVIGFWKLIGRIIANTIGTVVAFILHWRQIPAALATVFKGAVSLAVSWGKKIGKGLLTALVSVFTAAGSLAGDIGGKIADWLNANTPFGDQVNLGVVKFRIPALARGGDIVGGGYALVGERGPEVVRLPGGSSVIPNRPARVRSPSAQSMSSRGTHFDRGGSDRPIQLILDGRVVAEVVGEHTAKRKARS